MGAWNTDSFANDDAFDWMGDFAAAPSIKRIKHALRRVMSIGDAYLEISLSSRALAAAEVVAALNGHPHAQLPEDMHIVLKHTHLQADQESIGLALATIKRIKRDSELQALWEENAVEYA